MTNPTMPVIDNPAPIGGTLPRVADMRNRVVLIQPLKIERGVPGVQPGTTQDRITANVFVLDGGPLEFGGKPEKFVPHTLVSAVPALFEGVYISQTNMVKALLQSLPSPQRPQGGICMGRIVQGQANKAEHNPPWNLAELEAHDPVRGVAQQVLQAFITGTFRNPEAQPVGGTPNYPMTHSVMGMGQHGSSVTPATMATPSNPSSVQSVAAPAAAPHGPRPEYLPEAVWESMAPEARAAVSPPVAAPEPKAIPAAPTGWPQAAWESLTDEQRGQIMAASAGAVKTGF